MLLDTLHLLTNISVSKWKINQKEVKLLKSEAKSHNLDVTFE